LQWVGLPILFAIPVLTLLGVFGEHTRHAAASSRTLELRVEYPDRFRYRQVMELRAFVRNNSDAVLDTVTVAFDTAYVSRFSSVRFDPPVLMTYAVPLRAIAPGETRLVSVELWGQRYGRHRGTVAAYTKGGEHGDTAAVQLATIVFP
jgi:hypothetical protein